ncbi:MAG: glycosyltransferase family 2 protein [Nitrosomonas sp.]|nr:glycosyltransferase family 2 protein [Nitrosomonas sp.]MBK7365971.1 glycosyltransferase family 2 protein [Nitrosomonas sp.]
MNLPLPISLVIVNHNAGLLLTDCIRSVQSQVQQIIVIDNASTDTSLAEIERKLTNNEKQRLTIKRLNRNIGFAAACNIGIQETQAPFILFLNPDCTLPLNAIEQLLQVLQSDKQIGMVGGRLLNADGSEQGGSRRAIPTPWRALVRASGLYRLAKFWPSLFFDFHLHKQPLPFKPIEVEAISGALMLVRREAIDEVGIWDEGYFLHCEDLDWCMRFRQKGWRIVFVPDVEVLHYKGACSQARPLFVAWHKHKGMLRFYQKFLRDQYPSVLMWFVAASIWFRLGVVVFFHYLSQLGRFWSRRRRG